jgi:pyrrolidone-carboxylate peptidase
MLDTIAEKTPDRRPAIVICAYDADDQAWDPVEDLSGLPWNPNGARTVAIPAEDPEQLVATLSHSLRDPDCRAILLVGRTHKSGGFRVQMRAENRALSGGGAKLTHTGPAMARATAPVADMVRALNAAGLSADASSDGEDDIGSFLLYSILTSLPDNADVPAIGLLRAPVDVPDEAVQKGVKAAAAAMARSLAPLPRARPN